MFQVNSPLSILADEAFEAATRYRNMYVAPDHLLYALCRHQEGRDAIEGIYEGDTVRILSFLTRSFRDREMDAERPMVGEEMHRFIALLMTGEEGVSSAMLESNLALDQILDTMIAHCSGFPVLAAALSYGNVVTMQEDRLENGLELPEEEVSEFTQEDVEHSFEQEMQKAQPADPNMVAMLSSLRNVTELARQKKIGPVIGRDVEISKVEEALSRHRKPNVMLVGEPGVGKTAIVEGLAARGRDPRPVIEVSMTSMMSGTRYRGDFEARIKHLLDFAIKRKVILFIDEAHVLIGAGGGSGTGGLDAANMLKPALARGEISVILATTPTEMRALMKDKALSRRFYRVDVAEPGKEAMYAILAQSRGGYEAHHKVTLDREAARKIVDYADMYFPHARFPDKAFDVLDHAALRARRRDSAVIAIEDVRHAVEEMTGLVVGRPDAVILERAKTLESSLQKEVFGQDKAITAFASTMRLSLMGLGRESGCASAHLFNGPSGVGKTQMAMSLARHLQVPLKRIDMSEFMEKHSVSGLVGAPPGYVGYNEEGALIAAAESHPAMVLLLDEVEKAHPQVLDILLQIMDGGRLTSADGRTVSFRGVHIIMTANIGAQAAARPSLGFGRETHMASVMEEEVARAFRPEFVERLSGVINFEALQRDHVRAIIVRELGFIVERFAMKDIEVAIGAGVVEALSKKLGNVVSGRAVQRLLQRDVADKVGMEILTSGMTAVRLIEVGDGIGVETMEFAV